MDSFNWIQSHQKILMQNTSKPRTKNSKRENIDLFIQKKSEAGSRLIDYQRARTRTRKTNPEKNTKKSTKGMKDKIKIEESRKSEKPTIKGKEIILSNNDLIK